VNGFASPRVHRRAGPAVRACAVLFALAGLASAARAGQPEALCFPVEGTGYIVSKGVQMPVAALSPLVGGDSLVVLTGTITVVDFRTGQKPQYGAGTRLVLDRRPKPKPPAWYKLLAEYVARGMSPPTRLRLAGSVRGGVSALWPDSVRFGPGVPIVFEWRGFQSAPTAVSIVWAADSVEHPVQSDEDGSGTCPWGEAALAGPGFYRWSLRDGAGKRVGGGVFEILAPEVAEADRQRFLEQAGRDAGPATAEFAAAVRASAARLKLW
jgi:hypothetical protein